MYRSNSDERKFDSVPLHMHSILISKGVPANQSSSNFEFSL